MVRALVISPYPTVRAGLRSLLESGGIDVAWEAEGAARLPAPWPSRPDVALADESDSRAVLTALEAVAPDLPVVVLGGEPERFRETWGTTPRGWLTRDASADEIVAAVRAVAQGLVVVDPALVRPLLGAAMAVRPTTIAEETLTPRELEVLQLLASGLPNKTIARQLGISEHTAKFHVSSLMSKLGAASRTEAVTTAAHRGLLLL